MPETKPPTQELVHAYFSLSYANYHVLPRTLLQSMPDDWQARFVALMDELDNAFDHVDKTEGYDVRAGRWVYINECSEAELKVAGITEAEENAEFYHDAEGNELTGNDYAFLPGRDPIPHYNRGRTYIQPGPPDISHTA